MTAFRDGMEGEYVTDETSGQQHFEPGIQDRRYDWPQLTDAEFARLVDLAPDDMDREIRRILAARAPDLL